MLCEILQDLHSWSPIWLNLCSEWILAIGESLYWSELYTSAGFEPGHAIAPIPQCNWNCPLKKTANGTICPFQNLGRKLERKYTWRDLVQYRNCKLKQNVESVFYRTLSVQSSFSSHVSVTLYWTRTSRAQLSVVKHVTSKTCLNNRKLFRFKSKPDWIREKRYRRWTVY